MFSPELAVKLVERLGPPGVRVRKSLLNGAKGLFLRLVGRVFEIPEVKVFVKRKILVAAEIGVEEIPKCPRVICSFYRHLSTSLLALSIAVILWLGQSVLWRLESDFAAIGVGETNGTNSARAQVFSILAEHRLTALNQPAWRVMPLVCLHGRSNDRAHHSAVDSQGRSVSGRG
jgi:hypothetical protein